MRESFPDIVGNRRLCARLEADLTGGTLSHAYVLEGAKGTGKHTLALRIAAALACEHRDDKSSPLPCMRCAACRKILDGNSPDVIPINRGDKASLGVDVVRELRHDVLIAPNDLSVKIYVIEDAHLMTEAAQNALLLTLEEPPAYVLFLLLCESATTLLETIRSRAPTLRTEPIPPHLLREHLCRVNTDAARLMQTDPKELSEIVAASDGSIGKALDLMDPKVRKPIIAKREGAREFIRFCVTSHSSADALRFLNSFAAKRDGLIEILNTVLFCLRDLLLIKQTENAPLCFFADREEATALAYRFTTPSLLALCDHVSRACDQLQKNANVRLTLTTLAVNAGLL